MGKTSRQDADDREGVLLTAFTQEERHCDVALLIGCLAGMVVGAVACGVLILVISRVLGG